MDEEKLRKEFKEAKRQISELIKEGNHVNYSIEILSDFEIYKKCREIEKEIDEKGLSIERLNRLNEIKREASKKLYPPRLNYSLGGYLFYFI